MGCIPLPVIILCSNPAGISWFGWKKYCILAKVPYVFMEETLELILTILQKPLVQIDVYVMEAITLTHDATSTAKHNEIKRDKRKLTLQT